MKKKILFFISLLFLLTGCVSINTYIHYTNDKATLQIHATCNQEVFQSTALTKQDLNQQIDSFMIQYPQWTYTLNDNSDHIDYIFNAPQEINTWLYTLLSSFHSHQQTTYTLSLPYKTFNQVNINELQSFYNNYSPYLESCSINIYLPGKIISSSIGQYKNNHVTFDLEDLFSLKPDTSITIISQSQNQHSKPLLLLLSMIPFILVFLVEKTRKKKI